MLLCFNYYFIFIQTKVIEINEYPKSKFEFFGKDFWRWNEARLHLISITKSCSLDKRLTKPSNKIFLQKPWTIIRNEKFKVYVFSDKSDNFHDLSMMKGLIIMNSGLILFIGAGAASVDNNVQSLRSWYAIGVPKARKDWFTIKSSVWIESESASSYIKTGRYAPPHLRKLLTLHSCTCDNDCMSKVLFTKLVNICYSTKVAFSSSTRRAILRYIRIFNLRTARRSTL